MQKHCAQWDKMHVVYSSAPYAEPSLTSRMQYFCAGSQIGYAPSRCARDIAVMRCTVRKLRIFAHFEYFLQLLPNSTFSSQSLPREPLPERVWVLVADCGRLSSAVRAEVRSCVVFIVAECFNLFRDA